MFIKTLIKHRIISQNYEISLVPGLPAHTLEEIHRERRLDIGQTGRGRRDAGLAGFDLSQRSRTAGQRRITAGNDHCPAASSLRSSHSRPAVGHGLSRRGLQEVAVLHAEPRTRARDPVADGAHFRRRFHRSVRSPGNGCQVR